MNTYKIIRNYENTITEYYFTYTMKIEAETEKEAEAKYLEFEKNHASLSLDIVYKGYMDIILL